MSETTNLKLFKHDNPSTNEEQFDIENYLNGNWDKIDENVGEVNTNISNINSKNTELEKELKEMQEDFYQNSIRGQASGEYIHVEDSSNCRANLQISGNSRQEVVTDNLFNNTWRQGIIASETGVEIDSTETIRSSSVEVHASHLYSISRSIYTSYMSFRFYTKDGVYLGNQLTEGIMTASNTDKRMNANESSMTFTITNANVARMRIVDNSNNLTTKYTLTTDTINPDYPSEIKTVGSNVNLFDITKYDYRNLVDANIQINDKTDFRITATAVNDNCAVGFKILDLTQYAGKTLTIKAYAKSSTSTNKAFLVLRQNNSDYTGTKTNELYDESQNTTDGFITLKYKITDVINDSNRFLFIFFFATRGTTASIGTYVDYQVKLVEGTEVGGYSPYGQGCINEVICNKNIWNLGNKGNNSGDIRFPLKSGKYTLSFKKKRISNSTITNEWVYRYAYIRFYDKNDTLLSSIKDGMAINLTANQTSDRQIIDFTAPENTVKMIVNFSNNNGDNNNNTEAIEIQLEGEKATSFEQHEEQSYIMPVQKEMLEGDYFDFDNEEEVHVFGKKVLTGNESWEAIGTNTSGKYRFQTKVDDIAFNADGDTYLEGICDSYKVGTPNTTYLCQESIATVQNYLIIYNEKVNDTVENFEKGLSNKNVTIYYKLATPKRLKFTDEQKAVAKELNNARTYKNVTNIYSTDEISPIIDLDYAKDLETLLNNTQALAVNNASEGV